MRAPLKGREAADFWLNKKNYTRALAALRGVVRDEGEDADSLSRMGFCLYKIGVYDEARQRLQQAVNLDPNHVEAGRLLSRLDYSGEEPRDEGQSNSDETLQAMMDEMAAVKPLPKKQCPQCGTMVYKRSPKCKDCGYIFPHYRLLKLACAFSLLIVMLVGGRVYLYGGLYTGGNPFSLSDWLLLGESIVRTVASLFAAALCVNYIDPERSLWQEWKLDLGASALLVFCIIPINWYKIMVIGAASGTVYAILVPLVVNIFVFLLTCFLMYVFFSRTLFYTLILAIFYILFNWFIFAVLYPVRYVIGG